MSIQLKEWQSPYQNDFYTHPIFKYFMLGKLKLVINNIENKKSKIIDLGCGFGYLMLGLLDKADEIIGIDQNTKLNIKSNKPFANPENWVRKYENLFEVTTELIKTERPDDLNRVKLIEALAWKTGVEKNSIDVVCSLDVLEHIEESMRDQALVEIANVLKEKGQFIYSVPNTVGLTYRLRCLGAKMFGLAEDPDTNDHKNYHWKNELKRLEKNFKIEKIIGYPFLLRQISPSIIIVCKKTN